MSEDLLGAFWICVALVLMGAFFLPILLDRYREPQKAKAILEACERMQVTDVQVIPCHRYYGVRFFKNGKAGFLKCRVVGKEVCWEGKSPFEW